VNATPSYSGDAASVRRVLTVVHANAGGGLGGMETFCVDLSRELAGRGIEVTAVIPEDGWADPLVARFEDGDVRVVRLDTDPFKGRLNVVRGRIAQVQRWARLWHELRAWRPDVVHLHVPCAPAGLGTLALARAAGVATVISEHNVPWPDPTPRERLAARAIDRAAQAIVAVSRYNGALRSARIGARPSRHASISNGIPIREVSPVVRATNRARIRAQFEIETDEVAVGCLVRFVEGKGLDDLVRAFAIVRRERRCRLLLVGDGPLRGELEALVRAQGITDSVIFAGQQQEPMPYLDAMDVFALAVPAGSMSIALLEAMARGLPPVITFCGPEEAVIPEDTGLGAPPNDPAGLADALRRYVADDTLRHRLAGSAAAHVRRHFSIARVADDMLEIYAAAPSGAVPPHLRADGPPNPRPGGRCKSAEQAHPVERLRAPSG